MTDTIIAVLITGFASIITSLITAKATQTKVESELNTQVQLIKQELQFIKNDVSEHNHYAKLFSETVPVIQEQIKVINNRIKDLEED